jgi:hypothetical protein
MTAPALPEPLWLPAPERPELPVNELHLWRIRMEEPGRDGVGWDDCPVSRDRTERIKAALFRKDVMDRYADGRFLIAGPASGLCVAAAECDHLALIAVSRAVRGLGLDLERVRGDIPIEEMAGGFLDAESQWDLRVTWSPQEKAWKFFQFWTSNEACAQARPFPRSLHACQVREFSPEAEFVAALAIDGGPEAQVRYWDW